jgi:hypothetical protein
MFFLPSRLEQVSISIPRLLYVSFWGFASPFFESMEDVNALREPCYVEDPVFSARVDPDLLDAGTDGGHPLPVYRLKPLLHSSELKANIPPRLGWEFSNVVARRPQPEERLIHSQSLYKY